MEVLDRVYKAFSNLDRDFARSKKTRTEFITDKFGGDIEVGSIIILDALSSATGNETMEDIEKLTFVKDIFAKIRENAKVLDTLPDFSFFATSLTKELLGIIDNALAEGTHIRKVNQGQVWSATHDSVHFLSTPGGAIYSDLDSAKVLHCYNEQMQAHSALAYTTRSPLVMGKYYAVKSRIDVKEISTDKVAAALK